MLLKAHVDQVTFDGKRATGVRLKNGSTIRARKNVVSNASMWDTLPLLPSHMVPASMQRQADTTPQNRSFMHLHLGFDATGGACNTLLSLLLPTLAAPGLVPYVRGSKHCLLCPRTSPVSHLEKPLDVVVSTCIAD